MIDHVLRRIRAHPARAYGMKNGRAALADILEKLRIGADPRAGLQLFLDDRAERGSGGKAAQQARPLQHFHPVVRRRKGVGEDCRIGEGIWRSDLQMAAAGRPARLSAEKKAGKRIGVHQRALAWGCLGVAHRREIELDVWL